MKLLRDILRAHARWDGPLVLGTVVDVVGSSYRRPGARVLINQSGERVGLISGGCLEKDVVRHAFSWTETGPTVALYDTRGDQLQPGGAYGSGCDGVVELLLERVGEGAVNPLTEIAGVVESGEPAAMATVYRVDGEPEAWVGAHVTLDSADDVLPAALTERLRNVTTEAVEWRRSRAVTLPTDNGSVTALVEPLRPPPTLFVFGAGDDALPVANIGAELGWRVEVADRWPALATRERFKCADAVHCSDTRILVDELELRPDTYAIVMTHNLADDAMLVGWLLQTDVEWVGLLGPRRRTARIITQMKQAGDLPSLEALERLQTPVGLDLGGDDPGEVAMSIVAAIVAARNGRPGGGIQETGAKIHDDHLRVVLEDE